MNIGAYIQRLDENTDIVHSFVNGIPTRRLNENPDGKWSIIGILEHILIVENAEVNCLYRPSERRHESDEVYGDRLLQFHLIKRREVKVNAPAHAHPKGDLHSVQEFSSKLKEIRQRLKTGLQNGEIIADNKLYTHPALGDMTVADWLNVLIHHTNRHIEQIKDILNMPEPA
jgi:hypothetical protein